MVSMVIIPMFIVIGIIVADFVVVGTSHHHIDGEVALGGETHAKGEVTIGTQIVANKGTETQADDGAHDLGVVELITQVGVERHQGVVVVKINAKADTGKDVAVEIEAVGGRQTDAVGHVLVEMPGVALFKVSLIATGNADL